MAWARSYLSADHRRFLTQGGMTYFLGDGQLSYRPEDVLEAYYRFELSPGLELSLDWQRIAHPGYNADRGPVRFGGVRLHWEV